MFSRESISKIINRGITRIRVESKNIIHAVRSTYEITKGKLLEENPKFLYVGPLDDKTRPFCQDIIGRNHGFTEAEINELDNHPDAQLKPVRLYCGGYNCRHRWLLDR